MKGAGMLVVSLRGVNIGFWSHLGCSGQNAIIFSHEGRCSAQRFRVTEQSKEPMQELERVELNTLYSTWSRKHMANPHYCACVKYINMHDIYKKNIFLICFIYSFRGQ